MENIFISLSILTFVAMLIYIIHDTVKDLVKEYSIRRRLDFLSLISILWIIIIGFIGTFFTLLSIMSLFN